MRGFERLKSDRTCGRGRFRVADAQILDIYQRHRRGLFALALSITGCPMRAEDAVHDAFARLCRMNLSGAANADAYAFIAVRNAALDLLRRSDRAISVEETSVPLFDFDQSDPQRRAMDWEQQECVAREVEKLSADQREVVLMRIYGGLRFAQIAAILGAPLPTVVARYRRALQRLKQRLESIV